MKEPKYIFLWCSFGRKKDKLKQNKTERGPVGTTFLSVLEKVLDEQVGGLLPLDMEYSWAAWSRMSLHTEEEDRATAHRCISA